MFERKGLLIILILAVLVFLTSVAVLIRVLKMRDSRKEFFIRVEFDEKGPEPLYESGIYLKESGSKEMGLEVPYFEGAEIRTPTKTRLAWWVGWTNKETFKKIESLGYKVKAIKKGTKKDFEEDYGKKVDISKLDGIVFELALGNWGEVGYCTNLETVQENYLVLRQKAATMLKEYSQNNQLFLLDLDLKKDTTFPDSGFYMYCIPGSFKEGVSDKAVLWTEMSLDYNANGSVDDEYFAYFAECAKMGHVHSYPPDIMGEMDCERIAWGADSYLEVFELE